VVRGRSLARYDDGLQKAYTILWVCGPYGMKSFWSS